MTRDDQRAEVATTTIYLRSGAQITVEHTGKSEVNHLGGQPTAWEIQGLTETTNLFINPTEIVALVTRRPVASEPDNAARGGAR